MAQRPTPTTRVTHRRRKEAGFTLTELMAVLILSSISLTFVYYLFIQNSELYNTQQSLANAQSSLQFAASKLESDLQRAGYLAPVSGQDPRLCVPLNTGSATRNFNAVQFFNSADRHTTHGNLIHADRIEIMGNFTSSEEFQAQILSNNTMRILFDRNTMDIETFRTHFYTPGQLIVVRGQTGRLQVVQVNTATSISTVYTSGILSLMTTALRLRRTTACGVGGVVWISPILKVRYRVSMGSNYDRWHLRREVLTPNCSASGFLLNCTWLVRGAPHPPLSLADHAADLQFWFTSRVVGTFRGLDPRSTNSVERAPLENDAQHLFPTDIRSLRGVYFRLTMRTRYEDPTFRFISRGSTVAAGLQVPMRSFNLNANTRNAAHIRSMTKHVQLVNMLIP